LSPDVDFLLMPSGWDRYLVVHEIATHSIFGAVICGVAAGLVAVALRRRASFRPLVFAGVIGALSHVIADLLSGASIRVGWPLFDMRVSNLGVVGMPEPLVSAAAVFGGLAMWRWAANRTLIATTLVGALTVLTVGKTFLREQAVFAYRNHPGQAGATGSHLVEPVTGSLMQWRILDRTATSVRAWTIDLNHRVTLDVEVPFTSGERHLVDASRGWETVRNFHRAHDYAFGVASAAGVEWSDLRYCRRVGSEETLRCAVWAGGAFSTPPDLRHLIVRVGDFVQTR
jgi:membrane-bound metal-dependent hydrolase YbcI (DUF457 family)